MRPDTQISERVKTLREYYFANSPIANDNSQSPKLFPWLCHRTAMLYTEGWKQNFRAPTTRLRRAASEAYLLENIKPVICPGELIVGQPDYSTFSPEEEALYKQDQYLYDKIIPLRRGRFDHLALDYTDLLEKGVNGMIKELENGLAGIDFHSSTSASDYEYFSGCIMELKSLLVLARHYAEAAEALAESSSGDEKAEYSELARMLRKVPAERAETLREALQSVHFFTFSLFGIYSAGRPDQFLLPYYERDIASGALNEAGAQELIDCFCLHYITNMSQWAAAGFMIGGRDKEGNKVENPLTWHFLASISHTCAPDPNIGFCITEETSDEIMRFAAEKLLEGTAQPQIWNSDAIARSMKAHGFEDALCNYFTHSTCTELTPIGYSGISVTSPYVNILKIFLSALHASPSDATLDDIFSEFKKQLDKKAQAFLLEENLWQLERGRNGTDPMRISPLIHDCNERRKTNDNGGARYNQIEPTVVGFANVVESLNILRTFIYEEKLLSLDEMRKALKDNYEGHGELLLKIRNHYPHFGVGDEKVDALSKKCADMILDVFGGFKTSRDADVIPGAFSYRDHAQHGSETEASPDGRIAGQTLAAGSGPVQGYDTNGPTLALLSTAAWQPSRFLGGTALNLRVGKTTPQDALVAIFKGFVKTEAMQMQFTVSDKNELLEAQKCPEMHGDLLVRIGGYSDYFVKLPKRLQDDVISRSDN